VGRSAAGVVSPGSPGDPTWLLVSLRARRCIIGTERRSRKPMLSLSQRSGVTGVGSWYDSGRLASWLPPKVSQHEAPGMLEQGKVTGEFPTHPPGSIPESDRSRCSSGISRGTGRKYYRMRGGPFNDWYLSSMYPKSPGT